ncbi:hypothetical protein PG994_002161 [Apiospora phragmitis]|uniref:C2H2-type domain-containing protein n=1 Tax=Apiospora phragmitis TaxID=2905665 RepID=A0ABR1WVK3_9PEZI
MSPKFADMINSPSATGYFNLVSVEEGPFAALCEFAYTGDYHIPRCEIDSTPEEEHCLSLYQHGPQAWEVFGRDVFIPCFEDQARDQSHTCRACIHCDHCGMKYCQTPQHFQHENFTHILCVDSSREAYYDLEEKQRYAYHFRAPRAGECGDSSEVLMHHAKLYMLADRYEVNDLKFIVITRIHMALRVFPITWRRIPDLIPLIRFIYCNTAPNDLLRYMLSLFSAIFSQQFVLHPDFKALLQAQPDFRYDVLQHVAEYEGGASSSLVDLIC